MGNPEDQKGKARNTGWLAYVQASAQLVGFLTVATVFIFLTLLVLYVIIQEIDGPPEWALVAVLTITITAVIVGSAVSAIVYAWFNRGNEVISPATVFRESTTKFGWLASPIAAGYGLSQVISQIADAVSKAE